MTTQQEIITLKNELGAVIAAHFYQRDEVVAIADITGDSLELARKSQESDKNIIIFCGVHFMGQSVKILAPQKRVFMPKMACCSMARMIDSSYFDESIALLQSFGIPKERIMPITYINSNAEGKSGRNGRLCLHKLQCRKDSHTCAQRGQDYLLSPRPLLGAESRDSKRAPICDLRS